MAEDKAFFLPFHAVNDFMRDDFRQKIVSDVLRNYAGLPSERRTHLDKQTRHSVSVPGFRNAEKAPAQMRIRPTSTAFEKNGGLAGAVMAGWAELHPELRQQVYDLLKGRNWEVLPPEADRTKLPGFLTRWPAQEEFEVLTTAFHEAYPETQAEDDDISLMVVWVSGRLPYEKVEPAGDAGETE